MEYDPFATPCAQGSEKEAKGGAETINTDSPEDCIADDEGYAHDADQERDEEPSSPLPSRKIPSSRLNANQYPINPST
jgi:hypothetical protein